MRILIVRLSHLGDVVHALPLLSALRAAHPTARIAWTVQPEFADLLRDRAELDQILLFDRRGGWVGWLAFPFTVLFEWFGPVIEVSGYLFMILGFIFGIISLPAFLIFTLVAVVLGILLSISALMLEEMSFHLYQRRSQFAVLLFMAVVENLGYRQLVMLWRLKGLVFWLIRVKAKWGTMTRSASWQQRKP